MNVRGQDQFGRERYQRIHTPETARCRDEILFWYFLIAAAFWGRIFTAEIERRIEVRRWTQFSNQKGTVDGCCMLLKQRTKQNTKTPQKVPFSSNFQGSFSSTEKSRALGQWRTSGTCLTHLSWDFSCLKKWRRTFLEPNLRGTQTLRLVSSSVSSNLR